MDRKRRIGRELVGILLLAAILTVGLLASRDMNRTHDAIARNLEDSTWFALSGDWESARTAVDSARSQWENHRNIASLLADHGSMEEIDALFARIHLYSVTREEVEFSVSCAELSRYVRAMGASGRLTWQNLL